MTTINKILFASPVIDKVLSADLSIPLAVKLSKVQKEITAVMDAYDKKRIALLEKYGTLSENGTEYEFEDNKKQEFTDALVAELDKEVETSFSLLKVSELTNEEDVKISAKDVNALEGIVLEEVA